MAQSISPPLRYLGRGRPWPVAFSAYSNKLTSYFYYAGFFTDELSDKLVQIIQLNEDYYSDTSSFSTARVASVGPSSDLSINIYLYSPLFRRLSPYLCFLFLFHLGSDKLKFSSFFRRQLSCYNLLNKHFGLNSGSFHYFFSPHKGFFPLNFFFSYLIFYYRWISFFSLSTYLRRFYKFFFSPSIQTNFIFLRRYWVSSNIVSHRAGIFLVLRHYFSRIFQKFKGFLTSPFALQTRSSSSFRRGRFVSPNSFFSPFFVPVRKFFKSANFNRCFPRFFSFIPLLPGSSFFFHYRPSSVEGFDSFSSFSLSNIFYQKIRFQYSQRNSSSSFLRQGSKIDLYLESFQFLKPSKPTHLGLLGFCFDARGRFSKRLMAERNKINYGSLGLSVPFSPTVDFVLKTPTLRNGVCGLSGLLNVSGRLSPRIFLFLLEIFYVWSSLY